MTALFKANGLGQVAAVLLLAAALAGCSSVVDSIPTSVGGLPEGVPARPTTPPAFPAVHDMPPAREDAALSEAERKRLRDELKDTRSRLMGQDTTGGAARGAGSARNP